MHQKHLRKTIEKLDTLGRLILFNESVRNHISSTDDKSTSFLEISNNNLSISESRTIEHCLVITRLYSLLESFIHNKIEEWTKTLSILYSQEDLSDSFKQSYKNKIAHLVKMYRENSPRNKNETLLTIINDYNNFLQGSDLYTLSPNALMYHDNNLRFNTLTSLLNSLIISNSERFISSHHLIETFFSDGLGLTSTIENELNQFVEYRNAASHGDIDDILGNQPLLGYIEFIKRICSSIDDLFFNQELQTREAHGLAFEIGKVTEKYSNNITIWIFENAHLRIGEKLTVKKENYFFKTTIQSIQIDGKDKKEVMISKKMEVGLKTSLKLNEHTTAIFY